MFQILILLRLTLNLWKNDDAKVVLANAFRVLGRMSRSGSRRPKKEFYAKLKKALLIREYRFISPSIIQLYSQFCSTMEGNRQPWIFCHRCPNPCLPRSRSYALSVELRLALAHLEVPERAKAVLDKARKAVLTSHEIWTAACRLLEQETSLPTTTWIASLILGLPLLSHLSVSFNHCSLDNTWCLLSSRIPASIVSSTTFNTFRGIV